MSPLLRGNVTQLAKPPWNGDKKSCDEDKTLLYIFFLSFAQLLCYANKYANRRQCRYAGIAGE